MNPYYQKQFAQRLVNKILKIGLWEKPDHCSKCNKSGKLLAHHPNYNFPLNIIWLCQSCHVRTHKLNIPNKPHFYGLWTTEDGMKTLHGFSFKQELLKWIAQAPVYRRRVLATTGEVRRTLRRMAQDKSLIFPVEID